MTKAERLHHDRIASLGCIACRLDGIHTPLVSLHHVDGRTKPGCEMKVLPLCFLHHQGGDGVEFVSVHPWKTRFIKRYGTQESLLEKCNKLLEPK